MAILCSIGAMLLELVTQRVGEFTQEVLQCRASEASSILS